MPAYDETTYGECIADVYDDWYPEGLAEDLAAAALKELAGDGPALELGIGTGRVALPLAAQGIEVHGIDASPAMVEKLRAKPGGAQIPVTLGNFAEVGVDASYSLIFVVFNTFFALASQEEQVACFSRVANRLQPHGVFLIEAFVPDPGRFSRQQLLQTSRVGNDGIVLETSTHDPLTQRICSQQVALTTNGPKLYPVQIRYAWPSELDLMARLAGMRLRERWSDWQRSPFTASSDSHVSIYEKR